MTLQVIKSGNLYKASRVTGPAHNFLGLTLTSGDVAGDVHVQELSVSGAETPLSLLDSMHVVEKVLEGVSQANAELGTAYQVEGVQFVPTDSADLNAYVELAKRITHEAARLAAESAAQPLNGAIV